MSLARIASDSSYVQPTNLTVTDVLATNLSATNLSIVNVNGQPYSNPSGPQGSIIPAFGDQSDLGDPDHYWLYIYGQNYYGQVRTETQNYIESLPNASSITGSTFFNISGTKSIFTDLIGATIAEGYENQPNIHMIGALSGTLDSRSVVPVTDDLYNLGSGTFKFNTGYINTVNASNVNASTVTTGNIQATLLNAAGVVHTDSFGSFTTSQIVNNDISGSAAISDNKLAQITSASKVADSANGSLASATNSDTANTLMKRDGNADVAAHNMQLTAFTTEGIIHNDTAGVLSSSLIVNNDISGSAAIASSKLADSPSSTNTYSTIVKRDGSGNFAATTITANLTGSASNNVLKAGDTMTGQLTVNSTIVQNSTIQNALVLNSTSAWNSMYFNNGTCQLEVGQKTSTDSYLYSTNGSGSFLFYFDSGNNPIFYNNLKPVSNGVQDFGNSGARLGTIYAANPTINTSDRTEKENIIDCDLGIDFINRLAPKIYKYKDTNYTELQYDGTIVNKVLAHNRLHVGLIAQDVEQVLIDISRTGDPDNIDGNRIRDLAILSRDTDTGKYGLRYCELIPILINAIKELNNRINILEGV